MPETYSLEESRNNEKEHGLSYYVTGVGSHLMFSVSPPGRPGGVLCQQKAGL